MIIRFDYYSCCFDFHCRPPSVPQLVMAGNKVNNVDTSIITRILVMEWFMRGVDAGA